jgi:hypothetical protein
VLAAQAVTGETMRATVERALHLLVAGADEQISTRRQLIADLFARAAAEVDVDVVLSHQAWR